ncbi:hypothetical protein TNCV_45901 [Trichonephila clavipes]|nr:hypothetical protein TNCV_45901 [Trichonephila clavipes]
MSFGWEFLPHLSYSPDLASNEYHLLRELNNSFSQKIFDDPDAVKTAIQDFFLLKTAVLFIYSERWQEVIDSNGDNAQSYVMFTLRLFARWIIKTVELLHSPNITRMTLDLVLHFSNRHHMNFI